MKRILLIFVALALCLAASAQSRLPDTPPESKKKEVEVPKSYAWTLKGPLAEREEVDMDTSLVNYSLHFVPATTTPAFASTGNYGAPGETMIYFDRKPASQFFFRDGLYEWLPDHDVKFYNSRIPMTIVSYNFGGGKEAGQDRLKVDFSGNINARSQVGAMVDYLYSKGSFNYQAVKNLAWGFSGSHLGERYEFQGYFRHYNSVNKENGGITDDLFITDPAEIQGGSTQVDYKTVPTELNAAHNRVVGSRLYLTNKYKFGFHKELPPEQDAEEADDDSIKPNKVFVPVSAIFWNLDYRQARHRFINTSSAQDASFWENSYFDAKATSDQSSYWQLRNIVGLSLLEGFNKYAQAGLDIFLTQEVRHFKLPNDTIDLAALDAGTLTPLPFETRPGNTTRQLLRVGAQIARRQGRIINYSAIGEIGFVGDAAGEVLVSGDINTHIPLAGDTLTIHGYGSFTNTSVPWLLRNYVSNHFAWSNDFGKERRVRFGGSVTFPKTRTTIEIGAENVQNLVYFDAQALPAQCGSSVQVFNAKLRQDLRFGIWNWENTVIYQTSSNQDVIPLPKLALNSNMYILFRIAKVFRVQLGVDIDYYTRYKAVNYQPATMVFYNQGKDMVGNYPYMNVYANMKLSRCHFYVMFAHVNQGWFGGNDWFAMPHYPMNPRRLQMGLSVDFAN